MRALRSPGGWAALMGLEMLALQMSREGLEPVPDSRKTRRAAIPRVYGAWIVPTMRNLEAMVHDSEKCAAVLQKSLLVQTIRPRMALRVRSDPP